jgi:hypothetical protein
MREAHSWRRHPVVLDVGRNMLVVWMCALQIRVVRMRLRIVPVELAFSLPDLIAVAVDQSRQAIEHQALTDYQANVLVEVYFA